MADEKLNPSPKFPTGKHPELSPNPNSHDGLVDNTDIKPNTQEVNPGQVQEPRNLTLSDIIALILKYAPQFDPTDAEAGTLVSALGLDSGGAFKKQALAGMFNGKYVRIVNASVFNALTPTEKELLLSGGIFINGNIAVEDGNARNPVFFPSDPAYASGWMISSVYRANSTSYNIIWRYALSRATGTFSFTKIFIYEGSNLQFLEKTIPSYPYSSVVGQLICRKGTLVWYTPVSQDNVTSGSTIALDSDLGKALIDHLEVEINGYRARYQYTDGNYVVYSSMAEADSGVNLQVNMISYNTTNGELSFNQMKFAPVS